MHEIGALPPGERLVLFEGLVPGLVDTIGLEGTEAFLGELATKARRYGEAERHPGEGRLRRKTPGEQLGGPTSDGQRHVWETLARLRGLVSVAPAPKSPELDGLSES